MKIFTWTMMLSSLLASCCFAIDSGSSYTHLASDFLVTTNSSTGQVVLQSSLSLTTSTRVFFESDGRFFPYQQNGLATMEIRLDGGRISNSSMLDFKDGTTAPVQHSFNCIAATYVSAGTHTVQLVGYNHPSVSGGEFYVGSGSNLSVVVNPSSVITYAAMGSDSAEINVTTDPFNPPIQYVSVLSASHTAPSAPIVVLTSGRNYDDLAKYGDSLWGTYVNGQCPANSQQLWTVNDLSTTSETHAPLFGQALYNTSGAVTVQLAATELPYINPPSENPVEYKVGSTTSIVALSGNIPINGGVAQSPSVQCNPNSYFAAGTGSHDLWNTSFQVQSGQNGNVMFLLKTRVFDCQDANAGPGTFKLQLVLDGVLVGSIGDQDYTSDNTCHARTMSASYLAMHLASGTHTIGGNLNVTGMPNGAASGDLGLIYFGN